MKKQIEFLAGTAALFAAGSAAWQFLGGAGVAALTAALILTVSIVKPLRKNRTVYLLWCGSVMLLPAGWGLAGQLANLFPKVGNIAVNQLVQLYARGFLFVIFFGVAQFFFAALSAVLPGKDSSFPFARDFARRLELSRESAEL